MKVTVHLISMPWARPTYPSIQTGALAAYLRQVQPSLDVFTYSAHLKIPYYVSLPHENNIGGIFLHYERFEEYPYLLAYLLDFYQFKNINFKTKRILQSRLLASVNRGIRGVTKIKDFDPLTLQNVKKLSHSTQRYLKESIGSKFSIDSVNVVGLTTNYNQVYASIYAIQYFVNKYPKYKFCFVLGGMSAALPNVVQLLADLKLPVYCVLGEGEIKLHKITQTIESKINKNMSNAEIKEIVLQADPGVFSPENPPSLWTKDKKLYASQLNNMDDLPLPDYTEFFQTLREVSSSDEDYIENRNSISLQAEGTRGCFAKCEFCGLNYLWQNFRKLNAPEVYSRFNELASTYNTTRINFVDNVCDTWAEHFADKVIASELHPTVFMEMRAHHPEEFWVKLAAAGVHEIQIGVEALASALLENSIRKGTRVYQNIVVQKLLSELGIESVSNLITHHPGSSVQDVEDTKRVIQHIPHLQEFGLPKFLLVMGSPLFEKISIESKMALKLNLRVKFPLLFKKYQVEFGYKTAPEIEVSKEVYKAWDDFVIWYAKHLKISKAEKPTCTVQALPNGKLQVIDTRFEKITEYFFEGDFAKIYTLCHQALSITQLIQQTCLEEKYIQSILDRFLEQKLIIHVDERYISLALRTKESIMRLALNRSQATQVFNQSQN
ncbi:MAG: radical SAM protein [Pseudobdellovibrio sp.]